MRNDNFVRMRIYRIIGHAFFALLFLLAAIFYLERILYADSAFYLLKMIRFVRLNPETGRFSAVLTQLLPFAAIQFGLSLKTVIFLFSVSFILIYYGVYLLSVYVLKSDVAGMVILLALVLGIRHSFFHPVTETHQAVIYSMLFYAWLNHPLQEGSRKVGKVYFIFIGLAIILLCYFSHPVALFPILFIIGYRIVYNQEWRNYILYLMIFLTLLVFSAKLFIVKANAYEEQYFTSIRNFAEIIGNFFQLYSFKFFIKRAAGIYLFTVIIGLITTAWYIRKEENLRLAYYLLAGGAFFVFTVITYHMGDSDMAMERSFMPLSIFVCIPFVHEILHEAGKEKLKLAFVSLVLLISVAGIIHTGGFYRKRLAYLDELFEKYPDSSERKMVIEKKNVDMNKILIPWAIGPETLLYSSLDSPDETRSIFLADSFEDFSYETDNNNLFMCVPFWRDWSADELNRDYFRLPPGPYRMIPESLPEN